MGRLKPRQFKPDQNPNHWSVIRRLAGAATIVAGLGFSFSQSLEAQQFGSGGDSGGVVIQPPSGGRPPVSGPNASNYGFPSPTAPENSSWSNPLAGAAQAVQNAFTPAPQRRVDQLPVGDATSIRTALPEINANVHLQAARLASGSGRVDEAKRQYESVLAIDPQNVEALISLARIADIRHGLNAAAKIYIKALNLHPKNAAVHNDFGMSAARHDRPDIALSAFQQAVKLAPKKVLYRNNLAKALLRAGRNQEALSELVRAHPPATAHYNFAYLLRENGAPADQVLFHLRQSLRLDNRLESARRLFDRVAGEQQALQQTAEFDSRQRLGQSGQAPSGQSHRRANHANPSGIRVGPAGPGPQQFNNRFVTPPEVRTSANGQAQHQQRPTYTAARFPAPTTGAANQQPVGRDQSMFRSPQSRGPVYLPPAAPGPGWQTR